MKSGTVLLLILAMSCGGRGFQPSGGTAPLSVGGFYDMTESVYSNNCGPGVLARKELLRIKVEHSAGSGLAKIIVNDRFFYDATIRADGNFAVAAIRGGDARGSFTRTITGRFTENAMFARMTVDSIKPVVQTGRAQGVGDQALRDCAYQMRWEAQKL